MSRFGITLVIIFLFLVIAATASAADNDGMPRWWEKKYQLNPNKNDGQRDPDLDGLVNRREYRLRINPRKVDSDNDGIDDGLEARFGFNPRRPDAEEDKDGDGVSNLDEVKGGNADRSPVEQPVNQPQPSIPEQRGLFVVDCARTARKNLDPIIAPGRPGAIHDHDFFGPQTVADSDRPADLIAKETSCGLAADRSAYWMPTVYNYGQAQEGGFLQAYYFLTSRSRPYPRGLAMIAGKPSLTVSNPQSASWSCQPSANYGQTSLPACPSEQYLLSEIRFPSCWNGRDLDSSDHRSHLAYFTSDGVCPQSHPVELPELVLFRTFTQYQGLLDQAVLSSGATGGLHGDFVSGWDETVMAQLINDCRGRSCGRVGNQPSSSLASAAPVTSTGLSKRFFCNLFSRSR